MARVMRAFTIDAETSKRLDALLSMATREGLFSLLAVIGVPSTEPRPLDENGLLPENYPVLYDILGVPEKKRVAAPTGPQYAELSHTYLNINGSQFKATSHYDTLKRFQRTNKNAAERMGRAAPVNSSRFAEALLTLGMQEFEARVARAKEGNTSGSKTSNARKTQDKPAQRATRKATAA